MAYGVIERDKPDPLVSSEYVSLMAKSWPNTNEMEMPTMLRALAEILARLERIEARLTGGGA